MLPKLSHFARWALSFGCISLGLSSNAQDASVRGRLITEDTKQPIANAVIVAIPNIRYGGQVSTTTAADGSFSLPAQPQVLYNLCSRSVGAYVDTCLFGRRVAVAAQPSTAPVELTAPAGIPVRLRINDPEKIIAVSAVPFLSANPLDLLVYVEDSITRTRVPLPMRSQAASVLEYFFVIPSSRTWNLSISSVRFMLTDELTSRQYVVDSPISTDVRNADGEAVREFSIRRK